VTIRFTMDAIVVVALLALAGVGGYLLARRRAERPDGGRARSEPPIVPARGPDRGDVRRLRVGDVVRSGFDDLIIRETYHLEEGGFTWQEHRADNGRWLSVEDDDELEVAWWEAVETAAPEPGPERLELDGVTFRRREHGRASFRSERADGPGPSGTVEYYDYVGPDGQLLGFERFSAEGSWEVSRGRTVNPTADLDIYPGTL